MDNFMRFSKKRFEYELCRIKRESDIFGWIECSEMLQEEFDCNLWEYVYMFNTNNKSLKILIYSSIDMRDDMSREYSSDAVRVVYRWTTKNGILYKKIAKHLRVRTLFDTLERTLVNNSFVDSIDTTGWVKSDELELG